MILKSIEKSKTYSCRVNPSTFLDYIWKCVESFKKDVCFKTYKHIEFWQSIEVEFIKEKEDKIIIPNIKLSRIKQL